jgi:hypothetical protein
MAAPAPAEGFWCVALNDGPLDDTPTWTRMDTIVKVPEIRISRGKADEGEKTKTGTAEIDVNDTASLIDPLNEASPYFDKLIGRQTAVSEWNPVTSEWQQLYQGVIDDIVYDVDKSQRITRCTVMCVDRFDYLSNLELLPGSNGDTPPASLDDGVVWYEDGPVDDRIIQMLTEASIPSPVGPGGDLAIFSGNVTLQETPYDAGDDMLGALWDCADAEFPDAANIFCDRFNIVKFHGRLAKFDPVSVSGQAGVYWDYTAWKAGDGAAIALDSTRAQIRPPLQYGYSRKRIINAALALPATRGLSQALIDANPISGQIVTDATSVTRWGPRSWSRTDLLTLAGTTTGDDAFAETKRFATHKVQNYKDLRPRLEKLTFKSVHPDDPRAAATWALMLGIEISDTIDLETTGPGGVGGFDELFYADGLTYTIRDATGDGSTLVAGRFHDITLEVDVNPAARYSYDAFA